MEFELGSGQESWSDEESMGPDFDPAHPLVVGILLALTSPILLFRKVKEGIRARHAR